MPSLPRSVGPLSPEALRARYETDVRFRHGRLKERVKELEATVQEAKGWLAKVEAEAKLNDINLT